MRWLGSNQSPSLLGSKYATYSLKLSRPMKGETGRVKNAEGVPHGHHFPIPAARLYPLYLWYVQQTSPTQNTPVSMNFSVTILRLSSHYLKQDENRTTYSRREYAVVLILCTRRFWPCLWLWAQNTHKFNSLAWDDRLAILASSSTHAHFLP